MLEIVRGTTPNVVCIIPYDVPVYEASEVFFTITQDDCTIVDRKFSDNGVTIDDQNVIVKLTQEETLKFKTYPKAKLGIRIKIGDEALASCAIQDIRICDVNNSNII